MREEGEEMVDEGREGEETVNEGGELLQAYLFPL